MRPAVQTGTLPTQIKALALRTGEVIALSRFRWPNRMRSPAAGEPALPRSTPTVAAQGPRRRECPLAALLAEARR